MPTRRDLLQQLAGVVAVSHLDVTHASVVDAVPAPVLAVLTVPTRLSYDTALRVKKAMDEAFQDTPFAGIRTIVLSDGLQLTLLDAQGHVCNHPATELLTPKLLTPTEARARFYAAPYGSRFT